MVESNKDGSNSILDNIKIASPCPVPWDTMEATEEERKRFCRQCSLHVYDLSGMSATEAEELIEKVKKENIIYPMRILKNFVDRYKQK